MRQNTLHQKMLLNVIQGSFETSKDSNAIITTVLGSCIAVCLFDKERKLGGMNHFLLPSGRPRSPECVRYGANAMELLINRLIKHGAQRPKLEAKVFGGAKMIDSLKDIGAANAAFAETFLRDEGIPIVSQCTGGTFARRIRFWPTTGVVRQLLINDFSEDATLLTKSASTSAKSQKTGIELF
ncbi:chemotaxis protein CheD [Cognatishimia sp. F0-27]|nr:chemotaxis protein CheD [Cognatishimia sp. F0-27]